MGSSSAEIQEMQEELKWVTFRETEASSFWEKTKSKSMSNPIVPIGALATVGVLTAGLYNFVKQDHIKQQKMMRLRVLAQGVTLAAAIFSIYMAEKLK